MTQEPYVSYEPHHMTQENQVETTQELPAVSKLREAFDTARNAIIEGTELARTVAELRQSVNSLQASVASLERDLEYVRNRNRELDEQVIQVRQARDNAVAEAKAQGDRANAAEYERDVSRREMETLRSQIAAMNDKLAEASRSRDDAELHAMEAEDRAKAAEAKLAAMQDILNPPGAKPVEQPRNDKGEYQPYVAGSQGSY